jgi:hypothetical protein
MRVGTWNLAGRWSAAHHELLVAQSCDVWLLTEVDDRVEVVGMWGHRTEAEMCPRRSWAAVFSHRVLEPLEDPHPASAAVRVGPVVFVSSILPWRSCGRASPWDGETHAERTRHTVERLAAIPHTPLIWGGDWNHALQGPERAGSIGGRGHILAAVDALGLVVPTSTLTHRIPGLSTIDHVAVPRTASVQEVERVPAEHQKKWLSDHDLYIVTVGEVDAATAAP